MDRIHSLRLLFLLLSLVFLREVHAQFYETGQDEASTKWEQIHTRHFQIIFPKEFYKEANRFANIIEAVYESSSAGLQHRSGKIPVIFHTASVLSNGYVVWAPKRMELVATPPQDSYANDWLEQLALHELRHVIQIDKLNQGFTKFLSYPFGQMAPGAMTGFLPFWFLEGDAVVNETAHTKTGRGRDPAFEMPIKAIEMDGNKRLRYDQSYLGSYKNFVPSYYNYGYYMSAFGHLQKGEQFWSSTLNNIGRRPFTVAPFYFGMKKYGGLSKVSLYKNTFDSLNHAWMGEFSNRQINEGLSFATEEWKYYTSYRYPVYNSSTKRLFAVRSGIDDITRFVEIKDGKEKVIFTPGPYASGRPTIGKNYLAWSEVRYHPRWQQKSYSVVKILDRSSGKTKKLRAKSKHFAPSFNKDESLIAIVENNELYRSRLVIFQTQDGQQLQEITHPQEEQLSSPCWINDSLIALITTSSFGKKIYMVNLTTQKWELLYGPVFQNFGQLVYWDEHLLFNHTIDGTNNIYALHIEQKSLSKLTSSRFGAFDPSVDKETNTLYFTGYTANGYKIRSLKLDQSSWLPPAEEIKYTNSWADSLSARASINLQIDTLKIHDLESKKYNKFLNSINLHSWVPFYFDREDPIGMLNGESPISPGVMLFSQNKLSTVNTYLSYYYSEGHHHFKPELILKAWYPELSLSADIGGQITNFKKYSGLETPKDSLRTRYLVKAGISLPLNLTYGKYFLYVRPFINYTYNNDYYAAFKDNTLQYISGESLFEYSVSASHTLRGSKRQIKPKWGQTIFLSTIDRIPHLDRFERHYVGIGTFYFPAFHRNHSFYLGLGFENYNNRIALPRGYSRSNQGDKYLYDYYKIGANYTLPLFYPDWNLGPVMYFKRVYANVFYDYASYYYYQGNFGSQKYDGTLSSTGIELSLDMNFFRFIFPITPVFRYSYQIPDDLINFEFYVNYSISF